MDRKSIIIIIACVVAMILWSFVIVPKLYPPKPLPPGMTNLPPATASATTTGTNAAPSTIPQAPASPTLSAAPERPTIFVSAPEVLIELTNSEAHYTFTSHGGGLKLVELLKYPESVAARREKGAQYTNAATLNTFTPAPTLAVLDAGANDANDVYGLTPIAAGVRAEKALSNGLSIVKEFRLSTNYLMFATVRLENRSTNSLSLPLQNWIIGTATPMNDQDNGLTEGMMWSTGVKAQDITGASYFSKTSIGCVPRVPPVQYLAGQSNVAWAAVHNQFFALAVVPSQVATQVAMWKIDLPRPSEAEASQDSRIVKEPAGYEAALIYPPLTLAPHSSLTREFMIYAGPKEYRTLANISATFNNDLDAIMGFGFFGLFSKGLLLGMNWVHRTFSLSYGWTIIFITVSLKVIFWPLTAASTRSAKRMQVLQPQIKALQDKYKDDPVKAQKKVMEFWKEHKINPMSGCLPMLIQMPVFFGFFTMIRSAIELRGASFLWIHDLSRPDTIALIPGLNFPLNLLPLIMGATMLWQARLAPPSPGMDPAQAKMMRYTPLLFITFLYNYSSGMALYWTVNNVLSIVQTKLTKTIAEPATPAGPTGPILTPGPKKRK
jgi:YidC/Oxa1 family membrane protein insertase